MSTNHQSSNRNNHRPWAALLPVLLLAPLAMAPKGCDAVVIGEDCPEETTRPGYPQPEGSQREGCNAGAAGGTPTGSAGAGNKPGGTGGSAGKPSGNGTAGKTSGNGGSSSGNACGGLLGLSCAASEYCAFDPSAACGAADQTGVCTPKPQACDAVLAPVCACDGKTYGNDCEAWTNGSSVLHTGACEEPSSGNSCGGLKPATCAKSEYCNFPIATKCGSGDQTGTCTRIPTVCTLQEEPVCGCDDKTYGNPCEAASNGVSVLHAGACERLDARRGVRRSAWPDLRQERILRFPARDPLRLGRSDRDLYRHPDERLRQIVDSCLRLRWQDLRQCLPGTGRRCLRGSDRRVQHDLRGQDRRFLRQQRILQLPDLRDLRQGGRDRYLRRHPHGSLHRKLRSRVRLRRQDVRQRL